MNEQKPGVFPSIAVTIRLDGQRWFAEGVEVDVVAQGESPGEALVQFYSALAAASAFNVVCGKAPYAGLLREQPTLVSAAVDPHRLTLAEAGLEALLALAEYVGVEAESPDPAHLGLRIRAKIVADGAAIASTYQGRIGDMQDAVRNCIVRRILAEDPTFDPSRIDGAGSDAGEVEFTCMEVAQGLDWFATRRRAP